MRRRASALPDPSIGGLVVEDPSGGPELIRVAVTGGDSLPAEAASLDVVLVIDGAVVGRAPVDSRALASGSASVSFPVQECVAGAHRAVAILDAAGVLSQDDVRNNVRMRQIELRCGI